MYEGKTSDEIERGYITHAQSIKVQISGFMYIIDYERMLQFREDHPNRQRKMKRDAVSGDGVKGIAGIYVDDMK